MVIQFLNSFSKQQLQDLLLPLKNLVQTCFDKELQKYILIQSNEKLERLNENEQFTLVNQYQQKIQQLQSTLQQKEIEFVQVINQNNKRLLELEDYLNQMDRSQVEQQQMLLNFCNQGSRQNIVQQLQIQETSKKQKKTMKKKNKQMDFLSQIKTEKDIQSQRVSQNPKYIQLDQNFNKIYENLKNNLSQIDQTKEFTRQRLSVRGKHLVDQFKSQINTIAKERQDTIKSNLVC